MLWTAVEWNVDGASGSGSGSGEAKKKDVDADAKKDAEGGDRMDTA